MKNKLKLIAGGITIFIILIVLMLFYENKPNKLETDIYAHTTVMRGNFDVMVVTTGELQAKNHYEILAPDMLRSRNLRITNINITDIIPEGTIVGEGDYIGMLDKTDLDNTLKTEIENLINMESNYEVAQLDSAVTLSNLRDQILNAEFSIDEARINLEQSIYEPPATIRKAEMNLDKTERQLEQIKESYNFREKQISANIKNTEKRLRDQYTKIREIEQVLKNFEIESPGTGMVIYRKDSQGNKRKIGSSINQFDLVIATLPDMSSMISKTYVNEVDISKIKIGQIVIVELDAFANRKYTGVVESFSNIGEQLPNSTSKVFEVLVTLNRTDDLMKPAMTSSNKIVINTFNDVLYIPLQFLYNEDDKYYVNLKKKQKEVTIGEMNENYIIIKEGLKEGDIIYLNENK